MSKKKAYQVIESMPFSRHSFEGEPFDINKSEVVAWLVKQPDFMQWIYEFARSSRRMVYDSEAKGWLGTPFRSGRPRKTYQEADDSVPADMVKTCTKCGKKYAATTDNFTPVKCTPDGLDTRCRACKNEAGRIWALKNRERASANVAAWRARNHDASAPDLGPISAANVPGSGSSIDQSIASIDLD